MFYIYFGKNELLLSVMDYTELYKIVLIGSSGSGKSNIISRYMSDTFSLNTKSTIGVEFATKIIESNGALVKIQVWDTAGQERFDSITSAYYHRAAGVILVYDVADKHSFEELSRWRTEITKYVTLMEILDKVNIYLVGNKTDLKHKRAVPTELGEQYAKEHGLSFIETSALDGTNINELFHGIVRDIQKSRISYADPDVIHLTGNAPTKSKCCT